MSKKAVYVVLGILSLLVVGVSSWYFGYYSKLDYVRFNREYENLNVSKNTKIRYIDKEEYDEILKSGSELIYVGNNKCSECIDVLPVLIDTVDCSCLDDLLYLEGDEEALIAVRKGKIVDKFIFNGKLKEEKDLKVKFDNMISQVTKNANVCTDTCN